jgi:hypothetical protein
LGRTRDHTAADGSAGALGKSKALNRKGREGRKEELENRPQRARRYTKKINSEEARSMVVKLVDRICAWLIFLLGIYHILHTEIVHPRGVTLDIGLLWIFVGMFNFLRIRNGYGVKGLRTYCIGANLATLVFEILRWRMYGPDNLLQVIPVLIEMLLSLRSQVDSDH